VHFGADGLAGSTHSLADYNRAGTPLVEIVSEPDLRSGREAAAYGAELQRLVRWLRGELRVRASLCMLLTPAPCPLLAGALPGRQRRQHGRGFPAL
jgi:hypothetical protein